MRLSVSPSETAASTNSRSRKPSTSPRASRAISAHPMATKMPTSSSPALAGGSTSGKAARAARIKTRSGKASIASAARINSASTLRPA
jgi:hypothetical protein